MTVDCTIMPKQEKRLFNFVYPNRYYKLFDFILPVLSSETESISTGTSPVTQLQDNMLPLLGTTSIVDANIKYSAHRFPGKDSFFVYLTYK